MTQCLHFVRLLLLSCLVVPYLHPQTPDSKAELELGIASREQGLYPEAIRHLQRAVALDPGGIGGHFYLALVYDEMCIGSSSCEHPYVAVEEYRKVLELDPAHKEALKNLAHLLSNLGRRDEGDVLYRKAAKLDANDAEALYSIAFLSWRRWYGVIMEERSKVSPRGKKPLMEFPACHQVRNRALTDVEEGIALLTRAVQLVNYDEAQSNMALLYMLRAELQCGDRAAYKRDLSSSRGWWNRACVAYNNAKENTDQRRWRWFPGPPPPLPKRGDTCSWFRRH